MCAKTKILSLWLVIWFKFERGKMFPEAAVQILLMCVCHFSCPSTITPSERCSETCSIGVDKRLKIERELFSLMFLSSRHQHAVCFSWVQYHQICTTPIRDITETCRKSLRTSSMLSLAVLAVPSSADTSYHRFRLKAQKQIINNDAKQKGA